MIGEHLCDGTFCVNQAVGSVVEQYLVATWRKPVGYSGLDFTESGERVYFCEQHRAEALAGAEAR